MLAKMLNSCVLDMFLLTGFIYLFISLFYYLIIIVNFLSKTT